MFFKNSQNYEYYDLIVVGNNLAAVVTAGIVAKSGKTVALVCESELLLREYSEGLLGFVKENTNLFSLLNSMGAEPILVGGEYQIPAGMASKIALSYLKENNVNTYLKAAPIGLLKESEKVCGIAVATKFGAYVIKAGFVADFDGRIFYNGKKAGDEYFYAIQMSGVDLSNSKTPYNIDVSSDSLWDVTVHSDCRSEDTCLLTFKTNERHTHKAVEKAVEFIDFLIKNNSDFANSGLIKFALSPISLEVGYNTPKKNLLEFKAGNILNEDDYLNAVTFATDLINGFLAKSTFTEPTTLETTYGEFDLAPLLTGEELDEFLGAKLLKINMPVENAPVQKTGLFIAGLGAGGTAAMKAALDMGCEVTGAEALSVPGGTRGQGMVSAFWHGYQNGFATENVASVKSFSKASLGKSVPPYTAEMIYDIRFMKSATVFYESIVFDAIKENGNTVGALLATPDGIVKILAKKSIDATGDADLAALAGVEYHKNGDLRDKVTQGYSIWGEEKIGTMFKDSLYKSDEDSVSTEKYSEFLRGIYTAHLKQSDLGFSALLTVRESRRIKGKYTLNMKDILQGKTFDDTITVSLCKYDAHGMGSSPAYYTNIFNALKSKPLPDEVLTRIPLRALLPEKDGGLMVVSKAISATRDAGCLIRMNPDIQNTGYSGGTIAANAVLNNLSFDAAYTDEIKNLLTEKSLLPDYYNQKTELNACELIEKIKSGDLWAIAVATTCNEYLSDFEKAYKGEKGLALVLSALGSEISFDDMLKEFEDFINTYSNENNNAEKIKNHAVLLSRIAVKNEDKKSAFIPLLKKAIEVIDAGGGYGNPEKGIYQNSKVSNRIVPNFRAIMGIVIAAETVADKALSATLMDLSKKKNISLSDGEEIHSVQLYLRIMAAAARCGDEQAKSEMEKYLFNGRLFFREFVKEEIETLNTAKTEFLPVEQSEFWI